MATEELVTPEGTRRQPMQRRSIERVVRLLDTCAALLDEVGYEALTTREVARRAGVPVGTLYQFFTDKQALVRALATRNLETFVARLHERFVNHAPRSWAAAAAIVVDEYVTRKRTVPGFAVVDFGLAQPGRPYLLDATDARENNEIVAERLGALATGELGLPGGAGVDGLNTVLLVAVETADNLLRLAFRRDPDGDPAIIAETTELLSDYLTSRLG
jgi:AcrR family transcriptional regulator